MAFKNDAIDGNLFAGANAQLVAGLNAFEGNAFLRHRSRRIGGEQAGGFRAEIEQSADGGAGAAAGTEFHHLSEQDEGGDGGGRFEVDVGISLRHGVRVQLPYSDCSCCAEIPENSEAR